MATSDSDHCILFKNATDAQTDMEKLKSCQVDFRLTGICDKSWLTHRQLPQFFVVTAHVKDQFINIYVNENVIGAKLILQLLSMKIFTDEEVLWSYFETSDGKTKFELHTHLGKQLNDIHITVKQRAPIEPNLTVFVKTLTGKTHQIQSSSKETICMLKCRIQFTDGALMSQQQLIFQGKELADERTLSEYGIGNSSTLHLVLALRGGKPVIRLRSTTGQSIANVNVHLHLDNIWKFSCIYPEPAHTDRTSFVEWNDIEVFPDGHLMMKQKHQTNASKLMVYKTSPLFTRPVVSDHLSRYYPSIDDELEHRMLFWEALTIDYSSWDIGNGLCVPRVDFTRILNYLLKKMFFSLENRDDMITYILPHLEEIDPNHVHENVLFRFLSPNEYSSSAELKVRPEPDRIIRTFLLYRLTDDEHTAIATIEELENEVKKILESTNKRQSSGLIVHEWGSMFIQ